MISAIILGIFALAVIGLLVLLVKIVSGAIALVGGFLNVIIGVAVVVAMVLIVLWMFSYAKRHR